MPLPSWASAYIGIPFQMRGRTHQGADCWGLGWLVDHEILKLDTPAYGDVKDEFDKEEIAALIAGRVAAGWLPVRLGEERLGDRIIFRMLGCECHVGTVLEPPFFLHVLPPRIPPGTAPEEGIQQLSCIERYDSLKWRKRVAGFHRFDGKR
jgi:cell wall-associated NlpC family hydrolase